MIRIYLDEGGDTMKKLTKILYMVILAFAVCGCSAKSDEALSGSSEGNLQEKKKKKSTWKYFI